ncbi:hypothetical protein B1H10_05055 [candidate division KSB1 bacterium 4484_188]|nr:MAG: hypothetical protein B1H10_05055 [candidate division KSB1 bacterium 4484_188]
MMISFRYWRESIRLTTSKMSPEVNRHSCAGRNPHKSHWKRLHREFQALASRLNFLLSLFFIPHYFLYSNRCFGCKMKIAHQSGFCF